MTHHLHIALCVLIQSETPFNATKNYVSMCLKLSAKSVYPDNYRERETNFLLSL